MNSDIDGDRYKRGSRHGELPPYSPEYYRRLVSEAQARLTQLDRFAQAEMEGKRNEGGLVVDWASERAGLARKLDQWQRETEGVICDLAMLLREIRDDQAILEAFMLDLSSKPP